MCIFACNNTSIEQMEVNMSDYLRQLSESAQRDESEAYDIYARAEGFYKDTLSVLVGQCKKHRFLLNASDLESMMEGVQEGLWNDSEVDWAHDLITNHASIYPANRAQLCEDAAEALIDDFRVKPVDAGVELRNAIFSMTQLRDPATNPATVDLLQQISRQNITASVSEGL
jgi:hypothetical protein